MIRIILIIVFCFLFSSSALAQVVINEFMPRGLPEWVEFYNGGTSEVNFGNYFFDDDIDFNSDTGSSAKINLQGILPSGGLCYWEMTSFLNDGGDNPTLFAGNGDILDTYSYASSSAGLSYSRIPDGGIWQVNVSPSKTSISCLSLPTPTPTPTSTPTPTPSPTPTPTPTNTPTPTPTSTPTMTPTPRPSASPTVSPSASASAKIIPTGLSLVLGESSQAATPSGLVSEKAKDQPVKPLEKKNILTPVFLILGALAILGAGLSTFWLKRKKGI